MDKVSHFNVISERDIAQDQPDKWHLFNMPTTETTKRETKKIQQKFPSIWAEIYDTPLKIP